jgi:hypothetical protein
VAESAGGRRNIIDTVLVSRVPEQPAEPAQEGDEVEEEQTVDG